MLHLALAHRPTVVGLSAASVVAAALHLPDAADRVLDADRRGPGAGERRAARRARASRSPTPVLDRVEQMIRRARARSDRHDRERGRGRRRLRARRPRRRRRRQPRQHPAAADAEGRADAVERADRDGSAPPALGHPGRDRPRERVGRQQPDESVPLGRRRQRRRRGLLRSRFAARTSSESQRRRAGRPRTCSTRCRASPTPASAATKAVRSWRCASIARRRRCSASAPRRSPTRSGPTSPARRRRCSAQGGNEYPIIVRLREDERQVIDRRRGRADQHAAGPGDAGQEPDARRERRSARCRFSGRTSSASRS